MLCTAKRGNVSIPLRSRSKKWRASATSIRPGRLVVGQFPIIRLVGS